MTSVVSGRAEHFGVYVDGDCEVDHPTYAVALQRVRERGRGFVWVSIADPDHDHMRSIADAFDLHPLAVKHALQRRGRPRVEWYDRCLVVGLKTVSYAEYGSNPGLPADGQIALFVGRDFLITCRRGEHTAVAEVLDRVANSPVLEPSAVMHAIADRVVGSYLEVAEGLRLEADLVEQNVFSQSADGDIERIYFLKREIVHMRRSIEPLTHALGQFATEHGEVISVEVCHAMRDVSERCVHAIERIVSTEALLESLLDSAFGRESTRQNVDLRRISAWAAIGSVPTTVAGIFGMRFANMPGLQWAWGYPVVMASMALVMTILYRTFHRRRWL